MGRRFRIFALKSRFIQNFELGTNNWSLQINGRITKSRFIKIFQSRFNFVKVALFQKFELRWNNWSLQINGRITKSRFIKISQSRFIFAKVALFKISKYWRIIGNCR